ncbi:hypothetical protein N665_0055s0018 [Sinapis alba]|nr:hypothetical protein N665_0055s0018 [Sinapis alba]
MFPPISIGNTRQLKNFIGKIRGFDGICGLCIRVLHDSTSSNKQATDTCASPIPLNYVSEFGSTVQREQHVHHFKSLFVLMCLFDLIFFFS